MLCIFLTLVALTCSKNLPLTCSKVANLQKARNSAQVQKTPRNHSPARVTPEASDSYNHFRYVITTNIYEQNTDSWRNLTDFGKYWVYISDTEFIQKTSELIYDQFLNKIMVDTITDYRNLTEYTISQIGDNGEVKCTFEKISPEMKAVSREYDYLGTGFIALDEVENNWILWGNRLCGFYLNDSSSPGDIYIQGYDLYTNPQELRYYQHTNSTVESYVVYNAQNGNAFDVSEVTVPEEIECESNGKENFKFLPFLREMF